MKKVSLYLIVTALLLIVIGVVCMVKPNDGFESMAQLLAILIMLAGLSTLLFGIRSKGQLPNTGMTTFLGIFELVVGLLFLVNGLLAATTLIVVFAMWVLFEGISLSVLAFDYRKSGYDRWWMMLLLGICSIVLGFAAMCNPESTGALLGILLGLGLFSNGIIRLVAFVALRRIHSTLRDMKDSATAIEIDDTEND